MACKHTDINEPPHQDICTNNLHKCENKGAFNCTSIDMLFPSVFRDISQHGSGARRGADLLADLSVSTPLFSLHRLTSHIFPTSELSSFLSSETANVIGNN